MADETDADQPDDGPREIRRRSSGRFRHGDNPDGLPSRLGIHRSIRPEMPCPPTLFVAELIHGGLFLQGWPLGPSAYLSPEDAAPLKRELVAAFEDEEPAPRDSEDTAR